MVQCCTFVDISNSFFLDLLQQLTTKTHTGTNAGGESCETDLFFFMRLCVCSLNFFTEIYSRNGFK